MKKWHIAIDTYRVEKDDYQTLDNEDIWTISPDEDSTGWKNDSNQPGYGLPKDVARWIVDTLNGAGGVPEWMQKKYNTSRLWESK